MRNMILNSDCIIPVQSADTGSEGQRSPADPENRTGRKENVVCRYYHVPQ